MFLWICIIFGNKKTDFHITEKLSTQNIKSTPLNISTNDRENLKRGGKSTYTYTGGASGYTIDRWYANGTVEVSNGVGIKIYSSIIQKLPTELLQSYVGKPLTFTCKTGTGALHSGTAIYRLLMTDGHLHIHTMLIRMMLIISSKLLQTLVKQIFLLLKQKSQ